MSVILTNIQGFVEQVEQRRTHKAKPTELDTLECEFLGPSALANGFVPTDLAYHPVYPGMQCSSWEITETAASLAKVKATYTGKLVGGSGPITTTPVITRSRHLGSVSYTTTTPSSSIQLRTASFTVRFFSRVAAFRYLTNRAPGSSFTGQFASHATPYLGTDHVQQFQGEVSYATGSAAGSSSDTGYGGFVTSSLAWVNNLTNLEINDLSNGWFDVTETYETQPVITTVTA